MSYILERSALYDFVVDFLQFIVAPSCRTLCASVFSSSSECTNIHRLVCYSTYRSLQCWTAFFAKAYLIVQKVLAYGFQASVFFSSSVKYLVESLEPFLPLHISFHCSQFKQDYPMPYFPLPFYSYWYLLETIIEQHLEFYKK